MDGDLNQNQLIGAKSDAFSNLFVGLLLGSVLLVGQVEFLENPLIFAATLVFCLYLLFGYFNLFVTFHKDSKLFAAELKPETQNTFRWLKTSVLLLCCLLTISPKFLKLESLSIFYFIMFVVFLLDIFYLLCLKQLNSHYKANKKEWIRGLQFDIYSLLLFLLIAICLWNSDGICTPQNGIAFDSLKLFLVLFHGLYLFPFLCMLFLRNKKR